MRRKRRQAFFRWQSDPYPALPLYSRLKLDAAASLKVTRDTDILASCISIDVPK
jgi:hypothetical protein